MKEIKMLANMIRDEVQDAEKYAKLAVKYQDEDHDLSEAFEKLSQQEIEHAEILHTQAARLIERKKKPAKFPQSPYRRSGGGNTKT